MPHSFCISGSPPVVVARLDGRVDLIFLQWVLYESVCQGRSANIHRYMVDLRACKLDLDDGDVHANARFIATELPEGARVSVLVANPVPELVRFSEKLSEAGRVTMGLAATEEQAARWLYGGAQSAA